MAGPSGPVFVRFQDLKFVVFSIMDLTLKVWMLIFFGFTPPPLKTDMAMENHGKSHSSNGLVFPLLSSFSWVFDLIC